MHVHKNNTTVPQLNTDHNMYVHTCCDHKYVHKNVVITKLKLVFGIQLWYSSIMF